MRKLRPVLASKPKRVSFYALKYLFKRFLYFFKGNPSPQRRWPLNGWFLGVFDSSHLLWSELAACSLSHGAHNKFPGVLHIMLKNIVMKGWVVYYEEK